MRAAVITFPGTNREGDIAKALRVAGADVVHAWHADYDLHRHVRLIIALLAELRLQAEGMPQPASNVIAFSGRGTTRPARRA